jgi:hypothetical protein
MPTISHYPLGSSPKKTPVLHQLCHTERGNTVDADGEWISSKRKSTADRHNLNSTAVYLGVHPSYYSLQCALYGNGSPILGRSEWAGNGEAVKCICSGRALFKEQSAGQVSHDLCLTFPSLFVFRDIFHSQLRVDPVLVSRQQLRKAEPSSRDLGSLLKIIRRLPVEQFLCEIVGEFKLEGLANQPAPVRPISVGGRCRNI